MGCCCHEGHCECEEEEKRLPLIVRCAVSLVLALLGRFLFSEGNLVNWGLSETGALLVNLAIMAVAYLVVAYDVIVEAVKGIFKEHDFFNERILMVLASVGAFALRAFGPESNEFLEAVLIVFLYQIGEMLEDYASDKSRDSILASIDVRKEACLVETDAGLVERKPEELRIGDVCVYGVGKKLLCDGEVIEGECLVDESSLTGEAMPVGKKVGDSVRSLTLVKEGSVKVRVNKEYEDSTAAKMLELIEESGEKKSRVNRFIDSFAKVYTPIVFLLAILVSVLPPLFLGIGDSAIWSKWVYVGLSFLVVSCPCAIVISIPLAYFAGLGLASKNGILIKGAVHLDALISVKTACFDKTGTLTTGDFSLSKKHSSSISEDRFNEYLCACESRSTHPLGKTIVASIGAPFEEEKISSYFEVAGSGVRTIYDGHELKVGKAEFLGATIPSEYASEQGTSVFLSVDGECVGAVTLMDTPRKEVASFLDKAKALHIKTVLLSGDKKENVLALGESLGIEKSLGGLSPKDKVDALEKEIAQAPTLFIGDGINDAASIRLADVGVAMGGVGSDLALECADLVLVNDDISKAMTAVQIAKKTRRRAIFNIVFSIAVKAGIMVASLIGALTASFALPLWVAAIGDTGVALVCILSSFLITKTKIE